VFILYSVGCVLSSSFGKIASHKPFDLVLSSSVCKCGSFNLVTNPLGKSIEELEEHNRIVGGFVAPANSVPYQVGLW